MNKLEAKIFTLILILLTLVAVTGLFYRSQKLVKERQYDYKSTFVFRNVTHNKELRFKICFRHHREGVYDYYICHAFPPPLRNFAIREDFYRPEEFKRLFAGREYVDKWLKKFPKDLIGFSVIHKADDLTVTPIYRNPGRVSQLLFGASSPVGVQ